MAIPSSAGETENSPKPSSVKSFKLKVDNIESEPVLHQKS